MLQPKPQQINLSKILTVLQIGIFTSLLFYCTIIISQINFIKNKPLGIDTEHILQVGWFDNSRSYQPVSYTHLNGDGYGVSQQQVNQDYTITSVIDDRQPSVLYYELLFG